VPLCDLEHDEVHVRRTRIKPEDGRSIGPDGLVQKKTA
jgi:hypothetical protein